MRTVVRCTCNMALVKAAFDQSPLSQNAMCSQAEPGDIVYYAEPSEVEQQSFFAPNENDRESAKYVNIALFAEIVLEYRCRNGTVPSACPVIRQRLPLLRRTCIGCAWRGALFVPGTSHPLKTPIDADRHEATAVLVEDAQDPVGNIE